MHVHEESYQNKHSLEQLLICKTGSTSPYILCVKQSMMNPEVTNDISLTELKISSGTYI